MSDNHLQSQSNMKSLHSDTYSSDEPPSATTATSANLLNSELVAAIVAALKPILAAEKLPHAAATTVPLHSIIENSQINHAPYVTGLPEWTNETPSDVALFLQKFSGVMKHNAIDPATWGKILFSHVPDLSKYCREIGISPEMPWAQLVRIISSFYNNSVHPRRLIFEHLCLSPDGYKKCTYAKWRGNFCETARSLDSQTFVNLVGVAQLPPRIRETFLSKHELESFTTKDFQKFLFVNHAAIEEGRIAANEHFKAKNQPSDYKSHHRLAEKNFIPQALKLRSLKLCQ